MRRKVLMISHGYPPVGGSGMLRTLKFSRYLPDAGWEPVILTLRRTLHPRLDPQLLKQVPPGTPIYRCPAFNPLKALVRLREFWRRLFGKKGPQPAPAGEGATAGSEGEPDPAGGRWASESGQAGGGSSLVKDLLSTPDNYAGWYLPGLIQGLWAVLRHQPRAIYSTSPPATAHLIGRSLSRLTGLPWLVDFRDPWTLQFPPHFADNRVGRWNRRLESSVMQRAGRVICNTAPLARGFREAYPHIPSDRYVVINNGFDPADFSAATPPPPAAGPFVFLHTGEFFPPRCSRVPDPFLEALRDLMAAGRLDPDSVRVRLIGSGEYTGMEPFLRLMESPVLKHCVEIVDFMPHDEIPGELAACHTLLLFQNSADFHMQIPAKTFEYIRIGRPILAVAPPGATADLIASLESDSALAVDPHDGEGMQSAILELLSQRGKSLDYGDATLTRFSRPEQTKRLAKLLEELAVGAPEAAVSEEEGTRP